MSTLNTPNLAQTQDINGKTVETNKPKKPSGQNSSTSQQNDGSSLPATSQGVLSDTMTELNNLIPASGCPIKLPNLLEEFKTNFLLWIGVEENRQSEWTQKLADFIDPIVEEVQQAIAALKKMIKEIQDYIKQMMELVKEVQQFLMQLTAFLAFLASIPARLVNLIANCLKQLVGGSSGLNLSVSSFQTPSTTPTMNTTTPVTK